ncbi:HlyD family efflux transporter periplasmic adaptor subunit [Agrobacterium sp. CNPSo 2736]|uniref:HlyD family secretion protein n=1 Tax=Agrobacterium sp. CNPSo 2736 TaxID=2499627 RepID=UPI000FD90DCF|nr:HlyD family efflux transporter periplasmic adaptor subunit [Agrobacterium sp. CNPSo 2736]RVT69805.1 HlyD family efflux transporter periplasmic adaptor subunit [Agrobacterium sp. CNPSo 2736]
MSRPARGWFVFVVAAALAIGGYYGWKTYRDPGLPAGIVSGNGRVEAVEIDVSTKTAGRIREILADEGDFVTAGQVLAHMDTDQLEANFRQAQASLRRAMVGIDTAKALVRQRAAEREAAEATVGQRSAELDAAERKFARTEQLVKSNTASLQTFDDDRASAEAARATVGAAKASLAASEASIAAANAQIIDAEAAVDAAKAEIASIEADIKDSTLVSPRDGRVQYRVAQPGEVLSAGGRVLNLVDLSEVYMTFFLSTVDAGRVAIGSDVRLVLDAIPQYVVPAKATFVADVAQFTPKTVETEEERQKLMFRIKAQISRDLLRKYIEQVKTGLPGMAYVKIDPTAEWPANLTETLAQ